MITKQLMGYQSERAFSIETIIDVAYEHIQEAIDLDASDQDRLSFLLERIRLVLFGASALAGEFAHDLSALMSEAEPETPATSKPDVYTADLHSLGLESWAGRALRDSDINTVSQLTALTESDLLKLPNVGRKALNEVKEKLTAKGLSLVKEVRS